MQLVVMDQKLLLEQYNNLEKAPHIDALLAHARAKRATGDGDGGLHALQNAIELNQAAFGETARFEALAAEYMMMDAQRRFEGVSVSGGGGGEARRRANEAEEEAAAAAAAAEEELWEVEEGASA